MAKQVGNLSSVKTTVLNKLAQESNSAISLTDLELEEAVAEGLNLFNVLSPRKRVFEQAGDATTKRFVLLTLIGSEWNLGTSRVGLVCHVEDPNTDDEVEATLLTDQWRQTIDTTDADILNVSVAVGTGKTLRIVWFKLHEVEDLHSAAASTIDDRFSQVFFLLCLSAAAMVVAQKAAQQQNSSLGTDLVDFENLYQRWLGIASRRRTQAEELYGNIRGSVKGVGSSASWETYSRFGVRTRVGH